MNKHVSKGKADSDTQLATSNSCVDELRTKAQDLELSLAKIQPKVEAVEKEKVDFLWQLAQREG